MSSTTPTQRSLAHLRKHGWTPAVVERWNPHVQIRQDLFGFIDILAIKPVRDGEPGGTLGVQATSNNGGNHAAHLAKILAAPTARTWLEAGNLLELWSWRLEPAGKVERWALRREIIRLDMLPPSPEPTPEPEPMPRGLKRSASRGQALLGFVAGGAA